MSLRAIGVPRRSSGVLIKVRRVACAPSAHFIGERHRARPSGRVDRESENRAARATPWWPCPRAGRGVTVEPIAQRRSQGAFSICPTSITQWSSPIAVDLLLLPGENYTDCRCGSTSRIVKQTSCHNHHAALQSRPAGIGVVDHGACSSGPPLTNECATKVSVIASLKTLGLGGAGSGEAARMAVTSDCLQATLPLQRSSWISCTSPCRS